MHSRNPENRGMLIERLSAIVDADKRFPMF
jgi:hypothetical protein